MLSLLIPQKAAVLSFFILVLCFSSSVLSFPHPHKKHSAKHEYVPKESVPSVRKVISADFADPSLMQDNGTWYSFATKYHSINVQAASSPDFKAWTIHKGYDALPTVGKWVDQRKPAVWAPSISKNDAGKFVMYYSARSAKHLSKHCVGVAVADTILGPYTPDDEVFVCDPSKGGEIDASGFRDDSTGKRYVVYKDDGANLGRGGACGNAIPPIYPTPLMLQEVQGDGFTKIGKPFKLIDRADIDGPLVEAPSLMRTKEGKYILFFSSNCFNTKWYDISYAMAEKLEGPWVKYGPLAVTGTDGLRSPGGASVAEDGVHMVFHANDHEGHRALYTAEIGVDFGKHTVSW